MVVGYGKESKAYRVWESGKRIVEPRHVTFIGTRTGNLNSFDHDHNDGDDDSFLDLV